MKTIILCLGKMALNYINNIWRTNRKKRKLKVFKWIKTWTSWIRSRSKGRKDFELRVSSSRFLKPTTPPQRTVILILSQRYLQIINVINKYLSKLLKIFYIFFKVKNNIMRRKRYCRILSFSWWRLCTAKGFRKRWLRNIRISWRIWRMKMFCIQKKFLCLF